MALKDIMESKDKDTFIGDAINIATRPVHTKLNKLILLRLALAIPPRAPDSSSYVSGILHIAPLYICFESLWHAALHANPSSSTSTPDDNQTTEELGQCTFLLPSSGKLPQPSPRIHQILSKMFIPGLLRSNRLRSDLRSLTKQSDSEIQSSIEEAASTGRLGEMVSHIRRSVEKHPHVLLSYAWVLYMALFSGGRFIRATLENAGRGDRDFWKGHPTTATSYDKKEKKEESTEASHGPLQFFHFPTPQDGEDLKVEFKARLAEQDKLLTNSEKEDIVKEANCIFENLILVIAQLDDVCHTRVDDLRSPLEELSNPFGGSSPTGRSGFRIRDSVLVAKERASKRQGGGLGAFREEEEGEEETGSAEGEVELGDEEIEEETSGMQKRASPSTSSSSSSSSGQEDSPTFDVNPEFAARLEKAVHFDAKLPVPQRTESGNMMLFVNGKAQTQQQQARQGSQNDGNDGASDTVEKKVAVLLPRRLADGRAVAVNVAVCLGSIAIALALMFYRQ